MSPNGAITHLGEARRLIDEYARWRSASRSTTVREPRRSANRSPAGRLPEIDGQLVFNRREDAWNDVAMRCCDVAKVAGVKTIAEFVERQDIRDALGAIGVDRAQGYPIHRLEPLQGLLAADVARPLWNRRPCP